MSDAENSARSFDAAIAALREEWLRNRRPSESADEYVRRTRNSGYLKRTTDHRPTAVQGRATALALPVWRHWSPTSRQHFNGSDC